MPYLSSAAMNAVPSAGSEVSAPRYASIAQAGAPLLDRRFVSRVIAAADVVLACPGQRGVGVGGDQAHHGHGREQGDEERGETAGNHCG